METNKALAVIEKERKDGALVYAPQNLECPPLYKVEVTVIRAKPDEFHNMKGKYMANRAVTDRIGEAAGVDFIAAECGVKAETREAMPELELPKRTVFVGTAQGRTRLPDGSWRCSSKVEYEFDPWLRAIKEGKGAREALEYMTFARQRASTGARLGVIRQLTGMPVTFSQADITKPLVFSRIVQNTDYILGTEKGAAMAIAVATGAVAQIYGPDAGKAAPASSEPSMRQAERLDDEDFGGEPAPTGPQAGTAFDFDAPSTDPADQLRASLVEWANASGMPETVSAAINAVLDRDERRPEILEPMLGLVKLVGDKRLGQKGIGTVERVLLDANMTADTLKAYLAKASEAASVAGAA